MAAKKSKKERAKEAAVKKVATAEAVAEKQEAIPAAEPINAAPKVEPCEPMTRRDTVMVVLYSVLMFLAMTIPTAKMSIVLTVLAVVSLIGKKPLANLRAHLSLPMIGLIAFAWMCGAASLYSRFGGTAAAELYKIMASFSMAVILLARFEKKHVRGLLWGFVTVCAVIALVCVDMGSWGKLFEAFNAYANALGTDFSNTLKNSLGVRVNGIYNDGNLTGALLGMAILVSVYLAHTAEKLLGRFVALALLGISAVSFLVSLSRGAIAFFAVAALVYLAAEPAKSRTKLFFLMLSAGAVSACAGLAAIAKLEEGSALPLLLALLCGAVTFLVDWTVTGRLAKKLQGRGKLVAGICGVVVVLVACMVVCAFRVTEPYVMDESGSLIRGMALRPGEYEVTGECSGDVRLIVYGRTKEDFLLERWNRQYDGTIKDAKFTVADDVVWVQFYFLADAGTTIENVKLSDGTNIPMAYKFLPDVIVFRLQDGLLQGYSFQLRLQYVRDGLDLFKQSPLIGHGLGSTEHLLAKVQSFRYESLYVHNHIIQVMDEMGVAGLAAFLVLLLGSLFMMIRRWWAEKDPLAAALIACWLMMNLHSLMEINFSIRMYQCAAFFILLLPALFCTKSTTQRRSKLVGYVALAGICLHLAVFGSLLQSHRAVQEEASTLRSDSVPVFMAAVQSFVERDPFEKSPYQLNYVANAVVLDDPAYNDVMYQYAEDLYQTGTYATYSGLAEYYWLPQRNFDEVFASVRLAIRQVPADSETWNQQMDFLRSDVMPLMQADMDAFVEGVLQIEEERVEFNAGQMENVEFSKEHQTFLQTVMELSDTGLSQEELYLALSGEAAS